jgi:hypothetical protein
VLALVLAYYVLLRSVLRSQPELRRCLTRCRHCRIYFLTDPRNTGRCDLGCPFGCQEAHHKRQSNLRSKAYYQTKEGKDKKRDLNAKRRKGAAAPSASEPTPTPAEPGSTAPESAPATPSPPPWPRSILEYLCMVVGLIEGRRVSVSEILEMLRRTVRQHRMVRHRRIDQTVASLHERPP